MKCNECGTVFDMPDRIRENMGECFGFPAYEDRDVCPYCQSEDIEESIACKVCGEESEYEICEKCIKELSTDEKVLKYSDRESEEIEIGGIYAYHLSRSQIEEILLRELKQSGKWQELKEDFIKSDYSDYIDWLEERV